MPLNWRHALYHGTGGALGQFGQHHQNLGLFAEGLLTSPQPSSQAVESLCLHNMGAKLYTRLQQARKAEKPPACTTTLSTAACAHVTSPPLHLDRYARRDLRLGRCSGAERPNSDQRIPTSWVGLCEQVCDAHIAVQLETLAVRARVPVLPASMILLLAHVRAGGPSCTPP